MSDGLNTSGKTNIDDDEPLDRNPLQYRSIVKGKNVIMDSGDNLEDELKKKYATKEHTHKTSDIITDQDHQFVSKAEKDYWTIGGRYNKSIPIYHGAALVDGTPTEDIVKSCTKHIETKGTKTYTYNMDNKQMIFAYPASYGKLNKIFDPNNFDVTSTFTVYTIKVTTLSGDKVDYYVYVNNKSTVSNFNMKFQWQEVKINGFLR